MSISGSRSGTLFVGTHVTLSCILNNILERDAVLSAGWMDNNGNMISSHTRYTISDLIPTGPLSYTVNLTISPLNFSDSSTFYCTPDANSVDSSQANISLVVEGGYVCRAIASHLSNYIYSLSPSPSV